MSLASILNSDLVTQPFGSIVRAGATANSCLLALADTDAHSSDILGTRLVDVAAAASGPVSGLQNGTVVLLTGSVGTWDKLYLSATDPGKATNVEPTISVLIGRAYAVFSIGGSYYAQIIKQVLSNEEVTPITLLTNKGDLLSRDASSLLAVPLVPINGLVITVDSTATVGFAWKALPDGSTSQKGILKLGTTHDTACAGDDVRLYGVRPYSGRVVTALRNGTTSIYSPDGNLWLAGGSITLGGWYGTVWDPDHQRVVTVSNGASTPGRCAYSVDGGASWQLGGIMSATLTSWYGIFYDPNSHTLIAVPAFSTTGAVYSSDGGSTWVASPSVIPSDWYFSGCFDPDHNRTVLLGYDGTNTIYTTDGGVTWNTGGALPNKMAAVTYDPIHNRLVATPMASTRAAYSTDGGTTWTASLTLTSGDWYGCLYDPIHKWIIIAVDTAGGNCLISKDGGLTTVAGGTFPALAFRQMVYTPVGGRICFNQLLGTINYYTDDGGYTWKSGLASPSNAGPIPAVCFP